MWFNIRTTFLVIFVLCLSVYADKDKSELMKKAEFIEKRFYKEYLSYLKTGVKSKALEGLYKLLSFPKDLDFHNLDIFTSEDQEKIEVSCLACRVTLTTGFNLRRNLHASRDQLVNTSTDFCIGLNVESEEVCRGVIDINADPVIFAVDYQPALTPQIACTMLLGGQCGEVTAPEYDYTINVDRKDEPIRGHKEMEAKKENTFKIVHVSDLHFDPNYITGYNANCGEPTCCRQKQGLPENPEDGAKYWGSYRCDTPWSAVEDAIQHISETHPDAKLLYNTGDSVDHGVWETTSEGNVAILTKIDDAFEKYFTDLPTMILPVLGNHEGQPVNVFAPEGILTPNMTSNWLYNYAETSWRRFGLPPSTAYTIRRGGYYTYSPIPGFRVIILNSNVCQSQNWWNFYNFKATSTQLDWYHDTLLEAEKAGEKVHVLMHISSGSGSCYNVWSREFVRISERFYKTIAGHFNGHSHRDEFKIFYDRENSEYAINIAWNAGSIQFSDMNSNYRVYTVDAESFEVLEVESWYYNMTLANENPGQRPRWEKMYDFRQAYGLEDLSMKSLNDLLFNFAGNKDLLRNYWQYKIKMGDRQIHNGCNDNCLWGQLCGIVQYEVHDNRKCDELRGVWDKNV